MTDDDLFKESDCNIRHFNDPRLPLSITVSEANRLFREWLARGTVVTGLFDKDEVVFGSNQYANDDDTHTAILVNIRPIEPEDSAERVLEDLVYKYENHNGTILADTTEIYKRARKLLEKK